MNPSDIYAVLQWWLVLFIIGIGFLPLTFRLFDTFFDKGYLFSKVIGILLIGYIVFVLGVFHVAPFSTPYIVGISILTIVVTFFLLPQKWKTIYVLKRFWLTLAIEEMLFLTVLVIWAYIHSFAPDIHGLEKYMDYGFVNSFLRSEYLPPKDMWFTPFTINYYYFGHLITAMLTKLSGLPANITFNLMLSTIVALCFTLTFSIGANLYNQFAKKGRISAIKTSISGLLTAALVSFAGNLHILYAFFSPYKNDNPVPLWQLTFNPMGFPNEYWYPNATRFIFNTIHEFPIYSWVVADLHGHVLDIPFVLLLIGMLLALTLFHTEKKTDEEEDTTEKTFQIHPLKLVFIGLMLGCMYMTNAWDGAIYLLLTGLVVLYIHANKYKLYKKQNSPEEEAVKVVKSAKEAKKKFTLPERWKMVMGRDILLAMLVVLASFFVFITPYSIHFKPFASGIGLLCSPEFLTNIGSFGPFLFEADHCQRSPWWQLLTLYGFFYFFVIIFAISMFKAREHRPTDIFVALLMLLATFLIIIPEFFYLKDIYPAHYRANTMFKLVFQAFILLSISSSYVIIRMAATLMEKDARQRFFTIIFLLVTTVLVYVVLTYPYLAMNAYYNEFKAYQSLNGTTYLLRQYPSDYEAIEWLNTNVEGQPVILEAQGDSYTDYARVSANTGLPTVLGWTVHEWLWRGSYNIPAPRIEEIKTIYETTDVATAQELLDKYDVEYVFIGTLEYQKYPELNESKFREMGEVVFEEGSTKIYRLN